MKKYTTTVVAAQLINEKDVEKREGQTFFGTPVKYVNNEASAVINIGGAAKSVFEGHWGVQYNDGTVEVFNNENFKKDFVEAPEKTEKLVKEVKEENK